MNRQRSDIRSEESASRSRAALYMRVYTGRQAEHDLSIPDQRSQLNSWCRAKGHIVVAEFIEAGASASDDRRPVFPRLGTQVNATPSKVTWCCACGSTVPLCTIKLNPKSSASESSGCRRNQEDSFFFPPMRSVNPDSEPCLPPPQQLDSDKRCSIMRCKAQTLQL